MKKLCSVFSKSGKKTVLAFAFCVLISESLFCAKYSVDAQQGFEAYRKSDWTSAMFFLRKACTSSQKMDEEVLYMLVMSEVNSTEYKDALSDVELFLQKFNSSRYAPYMQFQKGRILHFLERNEEAVLVLSDFCHQFSDSELYAAALYWIAECFYDEYNFDSARSLYERVVMDFPTDAKANDCRYRLEMIAQREREEKLIYLLKVTGEENLASREEYERQIKLYQTQDKMGLRKSLADSQTRISELESMLEEQKYLNAQLQDKIVLAESQAVQVEQAPVEEVKTPVVDPEVEALKRKAGFLKYLLEDPPAEEK